MSGRGKGGKGLGKGGWFAWSTLGWWDFLLFVDPESRLNDDVLRVSIALPFDEIFCSVDMMDESSFKGRWWTVAWPFMGQDFLSGLCFLSFLIWNYQEYGSDDQV